MGHDSAKMTMLGSVWELLGGGPGSIFCYFCRDLGAMLEDVGSKMVFFWLSWEMLWHLGAKMAHKSAKTRQDNHQMIFEVKFIILQYVFDIGASKILCFTRVRNRNHVFYYVFFTLELLKHRVLQGSSF